MSSLERLFRDDALQSCLWERLFLIFAKQNFGVMWKSRTWREVVGLKLRGFWAGSLSILEGGSWAE